MEENNHICETGYFIKNNFLNRQQIENLKSEIFYLENKFIFNGNSVGTVWFNKNYYDVYNPITNINSLNLLETSVDIAKLIFKNKYLDYRLTNLRISVEKYNAYPLDWHSDIVNHTVRAIIYLDKVGDNNGSLSIISGSHLNKSNNINHKVNLTKEDLNKKRNLNCDAGDILCFDPNIIHKKNPVLEIRRTIMLEFQQQKSSSNKYIILIDNSKLTKKTLESFQLFNSANGTSKFELNVYSKKTSYHTPFIIFLKILFNRLFKKN